MDAHTGRVRALVNPKTAFTEAAMPGSFTMPTLTYNASVNTGGAVAGPVTITWVNLASDQSACSGAKFAFTLVSPAGPPAP